jgi:hypothetical protein
MQLLENKVIRIVEERGYFGTKYIPVVRQIVKYIEEYIKNNAKNEKDGWTLSIPNELTEKIDCVKTLWINIKIVDSIDGFNCTGGGGNAVFQHNKIVDGKLEFGKISIYGFSYEADLINRTVFNSLCHELNHLQEIHQKLLKKMSSMGTYKMVIDQNTVNNYKFSDDPGTDKIIHDVFYRLMFKNEFNALINSVYGDLAGVNSTRKNFRLHIKSTQAYVVYNRLKRELGLFSDNLLEDYEWENIMKAYNYIAVDGAKHPSNINYFKKRFREHVIYKLNQLMKGIGKIASFYYDSIEANDLTKNESIEMIDPIMKLN